MEKEVIDVKFEEVAGAASSNAANVEPKAEAEAPVYKVGEKSVVTAFVVVVKPMKIDFDPEGKKCQLQLSSPVKVVRKDGQEENTIFLSVAKTTLVNKVVLAFPLLGVVMHRAAKDAAAEAASFDELDYLSQFVKGATIKVAQARITGRHHDGQVIDYYSKRVESIELHKDIKRLIEELAFRQ